MKDFGTETQVLCDFIYVLKRKFQLKKSKWDFLQIFQINNRLSHPPRPKSSTYPPGHPLHHLSSLQHQNKCLDGWD